MELQFTKNVNYRVIGALHVLLEESCLIQLFKTGESYWMIRETSSKKKNTASPLALT